MKKVVAMLVVIISIFSSVFSFAILNAAQPPPLDNLSDLKQALPLDNFILSKELKAAAHAYEVAAVKGKDQKEIGRLKKRFLEILPKKEENVFSIFLYAITHSFDSVVTLLITHQKVCQLLCKNKNFTPELKDAAEQGDVEFLFSKFDDAPVVWHSAPSREIKESDVAPCLNTISDDCLGNILSYIDGNGLLTKQSVCREWHQLVRARPHLITSLNVYGRRIVLDGKNDVKVVTAATLAPYVPHLKNLCFANEQVLSFSQAGFRFEALSDIKVSFNYKKEVSPAIMQQSIENKLFAHVFPHVENMQLNCKVLPASVVRAYIKNCKNLQKIGLRFGYDIEDADIKTIVEHSKDLRSIDLFQCKQITGGVIEMLARECKYLQEIDLGRCPEITDLSVMALAQNLPDIRKIMLECCLSLEDETVIALAKNCRGLREICLYGCLRITDAAVIALAENCPLQVVYLSDCVQITDPAVIALAKRCPLQEIYLGFCQVTDTAIIALANHCPDLRVIYLGNCFSIKDEAIAVLVKNCKKLEYINLSDCYGISKQYRLIFHDRKEKLGKILLQSLS